MIFGFGLQKRLFFSIFIQSDETLIIRFNVLKIREN